jgi:hypothetical protein
MLFVRPYVLYRKLPEVQAESDGEFLYIHAKKEAKIPMAALEDATVYVDLPYLLQRDFLREFLIHLFSEKYGNIVVEVPNHGTYKLYFVANAQDVADDFVRFISNQLQ